MGKPASSHRWRLRWPGFLETAETPLREAVEGLGNSQCWTADTLLRGQQLQLTETLCWAVENSPYYGTLHAPARELAKLAGAPERFWSAWRRLPILTKPALRAHGEEIYATPSSPATERRGSADHRLHWGPCSDREDTHPPGFESRRAPSYSVAALPAPPQWGLFD